MTAAEAEQPEIGFMSMGMVVLDEIWIASQALKNVAGGSGAFATMGYRLFASEDQHLRTGLLVRVGSEFPDAVMDQLEDWNVHFIKRKHKGPPTRGLLEYEDTTFGPKRFQYTTPPLKLEPLDLIETPLLGAKAFHFLATPEEIKSQVPLLLRLRIAYGYLDRPFIVWEPFPASCRRRNRDAIYEACSFVDVFSPNHLEIMAMFGASGEIDRQKLLEYAQSFPLRPASQGCQCIIVRAGEHGALVMNDPGKEHHWIQPYYNEGSPEVHDPTGAGNAFLGGFIAGYQETEGSFVDAAYYGAVAASFALEQIGLPQRSSRCDGTESWNGFNVRERVAQFMEVMEVMEVMKQAPRAL